ncbi:NUDIX hydrolase [Methanobrevibacter curvatus]|nr:NUDIX domain-containing protein [Methanobrevibacter curvatus]
MENNDFKSNNLNEEYYKHNLMAGEEILDIYTRNMKLVGQARRDATHKEGFWHKTFHCWIVQQDKKGNKYILFQRRAKEVLNFPNLLDITVAGHILSNEKEHEFVREINEEIGLDIDFKELMFLGRRYHLNSHMGTINNEISEVYLFESNTDINTYKFQKEEVSGIFKINIKDGLNLFSGKIDEIKAEGILINENEANQFILKKEDFINHNVDNYFLKICIIADLYFKGYEFLHI